MFHGSPAGLGGYGSFGMMDTPGGTLGGTLAAEFSPMGPMLNNPFASGFGEHPTPPQLSLSRSSSEDEVDDLVGAHTAAHDKFAEEAAAEVIAAAAADDEGKENDVIPDISLAASPFSGFIKSFHDLPHSAKKSSSGMDSSSYSTEGSPKKTSTSATTGGSRAGGLQGVTRSPLRSERRSTL